MNLPEPGIEFHRIQKSPESFLRALMGKLNFHIIRNIRKLTSMRFVLSDAGKDCPEGSFCTIFPTSINASESLSWKPLLAVMGKGSIMNTAWYGLSVSDLE